MSAPQIKLNNTTLIPGETVSGLASWSHESAPKTAELRLFWYMHSAAGTEAKIVDTQVISHPAATGQQAFTFTVPLTPPSYHGTAFRLEWAVELVLLPGQAVARAEFVAGLIVGPLTSFYTIAKPSEGAP